MGKFNYFLYKEKKFEKFSLEEQQDLVFDLVNAFALANDPLNSALLLQDLLTEVEVKNLAKRLRIAKLILNGKTQEDIVRELHCSFATTAKVRMWLDNAGEGLRKVIKKLPERREVYIPKRTPGVGYGLPDILAYYASSALKASERKRLDKFLQNMRSKTSVDRDLREETNLEFSRLNKRSK